MGKVTKMKHPKRDEFGAVRLCAHNGGNDQFGVDIELTADVEREGLLRIELRDREERDEVTARLNPSQAMLLRTALDLWFGHLEEDIDDNQDDEDDD